MKKEERRKKIFSNRRKKLSFVSSFAHADGGPDNPGYLTLKSMATAIDDASHLNEGLTNGNNQYFGIDGTRLSHQRSGLNLVRQADGTVRKVLVK